MLLWRREKSCTSSKKRWCRQCCFALGITPFGGRKSFSRSSGREEEAVERAGGPTEKTGQGQDRPAATRNLPPWWEQLAPSTLQYLLFVPWSTLPRLLYILDWSIPIGELPFSSVWVEWRARGKGAPGRYSNKVCRHSRKDGNGSQRGRGGRGRRAGVIANPSNWTGHCKAWKSVINLIRQAGRAPSNAQHLRSGRSTNGNNRLYLLPVLVSTVEACSRRPRASFTTRARSLLLYTLPSCHAKCLVKCRPRSKV